MRLLLALLAAGAIALAACSGNFATGTGVPNSLPNSGENPPQQQTEGANGMPVELTPTPNASLSPAPPGTYALADAQNGFACPDTVDGYGCTLRFNLPVPPATHSKTGKTATPSPTPSPTPTPTPTPVPTSGASPAASPQPPSVALKAEALPKDAPPMKHIPANTLNVVPLMMVQLTPTADFKLDGAAQAQFTLPKEQIGGRGFAVQLFSQTTVKKHTAYTPLWTFAHSTLKASTLTFDFIPPKTTISKGATYALVLYGDDKTGASASPSAQPSPSGEPSPISSPR